MQSTVHRWGSALLVVAALIGSSVEAQAHCDTMSGPVIGAAQKALETGEVERVLIWVQPGDDAAIREEFAKARAARSAGPGQRDAAEKRFFEELVRIHRAGEGAPYTGIKPAGTDPGPAVTAADRSLAEGKVDGVRAVLVEAVTAGTDKHFRDVAEKQDFRADDVTAGRAYVKAYVEYTHYAEGLYEKATTAAAHHEPAQAADHDAHPGHAQAAGPAAQHDHAAAATDAGHGSAASHAGHGSHLTQLSWILVVVFGLALAGETGWILRRRSRDHGSRPDGNAPPPS